MRADRAIWGTLGVLAVVVAAVLLREKGPGGVPWLLPDCQFKRISGWHCPGCGMTRAAYATLHGRIGEAFRMNPLGMLVLPSALLALGIELLGWVRGRALPWRLRLGVKAGWGLAVVILLFWILRNLPYDAFRWMSPA
jgi:hypothetical protein